MRTAEEREEWEYHCQRVVEEALQAADKIILGGSDGSNEETDFLTAQVAQKMMERALHPFDREMLKKDLQ